MDAAYAAGVVPAEQFAKRGTQAERGQFARAKVEPKAIVREFRVSPENLLPVGAEISADHFVVGQKVDVAGI